MLSLAESLPDKLMSWLYSTVVIPEARLGNWASECGSLHPRPHPGDRRSLYEKCRKRAAARGAELTSTFAPRHVALAACESGQEAVEMRVGSEQRGIFSAMLQTALATMGTSATYRDLLAPRQRAFVTGRSVSTRWAMQVPLRR